MFASVSDVPELRLLIENAKATESLESYKEHLLSLKASKDFAELYSSLAMSDERELFLFLRSVTIHGAREITLEEDLIQILHAYFEASPKAVLDVLLELYRRGSHEVLTAAKIQSHLGERGLMVRFSQGARSKERIREVTNTYLADIAAKWIRRELIRRPIANDILRAIQTSETRLDLVVTSTAGGGKSSVMAQILAGLDATGIPTLAFRLDRLSPVATPRLLGAALGLDESWQSH